MSDQEFPIFAGMKSSIPILLGLGTNLGDKQANLVEAIRLLEANEVRFSSVSSFYGSPAWGITAQDDFINIAALGQTFLSAQDLLTLLLSIEEQMGRVRKQKWGPRLIDIDILDYGGQLIDEPKLQVPHPYIGQRAFVLIPLIEIVPNWIPVGNVQSIEEMLEGLEDQAKSEVKRIEAE